MMKINSWLFVFALLALAMTFSVVACGGGDDDDDDDDDDDNDTAADDDLTIPDDDADTDDDLWDDDVNDDADDDDVNDDADDDNGGCEGCLINNICYDNGEVNPGNACKYCNVDESETAWTNNNGVSCDDGNWCNGSDSCQGGTCTHAGDQCPSDGLYCNGEEYCDEDSDSCKTRNEPDCPDANGLYCDGGECNETLNRCDAVGNPCGLGLWQICLEYTDECIAKPEDVNDVLDCGETISGNNLWSVNNLEEYSCVSPLWWGKHNGPENIYFFEVWDDNMSVDLTWTPGALAVDLDILIVSDYTDPDSCALSSRDDGTDEAGHDELSLAGLPYGIYYVVVDGKREVPLDAAAFELAATCD